MALSNLNFAILEFPTNASESSSLGFHNNLGYSIAMFTILAVGFFGNVLTIIVFVQKEQRTKVITPFAINLAIAHLFIVVFGYPVAITAILNGKELVAGESKCTWSAFVNGATGISSIVMLTEISVLMCYTITSVSPTRGKNKLFSKTLTGLALAGAWLYGIVSMSPPLLGWSRFIPGSARISCCPDWASTDVQALTYNIGLVILGFFLPMTILTISYYRIYRYLSQNHIPVNLRSLQNRHRKSQIKILRMIVMTAVAFVISWSPYCVVSMVAMIREGYVLYDGEAEIPEILAKSSVMYNPIIYAFMSENYRKTLKKVILHSIAAVIRRQENTEPRISPRLGIRYTNR